MCSRLLLLFFELKNSKSKALFPMHFVFVCLKEFAVIEIRPYLCIVAILKCLFYDDDTVYNTLLLVFSLPPTYIGYTQSRNQ